MSQGEEICRTWLRGEQPTLHFEHPPLFQIVLGLPMYLAGQTDRSQGIRAARTLAVALATMALLLFYVLYRRVLTAGHLGRRPTDAPSETNQRVADAFDSRAAATAAAFLALAFACTSPNLLAHARLATLDFPATALQVIVLLLWIRRLQRPTAGRIVAAGVVLGAAILGKYSALIVLPICVASSTMMHLLAATKACAFWRRVRAAAVESLGLSVVAAITFVGLAAVICRGIPYPVFDSLRFFLRHAGSHSHVGYLLGRMSETGFWYYYPVAVAVKTPLVVLACAGIEMVAVLRNRRRVGVERWLPPLALIVCFAAFTRVTQNIGVRNVMIVYPLMFMMAGRGLAGVWTGPRSRSGGGRSHPWRRVLCGALLATQALGTARVYPHFLSYFNFMAGGPANGYRWLSDSNIDWGQDLIGLKRYMDEHGLPMVLLAYFGVDDPRNYGIRYQFLARDGGLKDSTDLVSPSDPVVVAISVKIRQGVPAWRDPERGPKRPFEWLKEYEPTGRAGYSIYLYDFTDDPAAIERLADVYRESGFPVHEQHMRRIAALKRAADDTRLSRTQ